MKFPYECCRCGMCCLAETCPIGQAFYSIEKYSACPGLSFNGEQASCALVNMIPTGEGCCIKARAYKDGVEYDFSALSDRFKRLAVKDAMRKNA